MDSYALTELRFSLSYDCSALISDLTFKAQVTLYLMGMDIVLINVFRCRILEMFLPCKISCDSHMMDGCMPQHTIPVQIVTHCKDSEKWCVDWSNTVIGKSLP